MWFDCREKLFLTVDKIMARSSLWKLDKQKRFLELKPLFASRLSNVFSGGIDSILGDRCWTVLAFYHIKLVTAGLRLDKRVKQH